MSLLVPNVEVLSLLWDILRYVAVGPKLGGSELVEGYIAICRCWSQTLISTHCECMCVCFHNFVCVLVICVLVFTVFCIFVLCLCICIFICFICTTVRTATTE
jgi:hypothetical protein